MQEPILEALTFSLESECNVGENSGPFANSSTSNIPPSKIIFNLSNAVPCPIKDCHFLSTSLESNREETLTHLLNVHKFVIDKADQIANFYKYILHWKERFNLSPLSDFCVGFKMEKGNEDEDTFFMISDVLPEDKTLRAKLWNDRIESVIEVNRLEREQKNFFHRCLFCKMTFIKNRSELFHHMGESHSFHVGKPDNLVFIYEFLALINEKMNNLQCIYCNKEFKDKPILREHMRKKQHKRINPANKEYDQFFIVNYLEPGKSWPALDDEGTEEEKIEDEWIEVKEENISIVCLLCTQQSTNFNSLLDHMKSAHLFDFDKLTNNYDFYHKVKIVNFIRRSMYQNICLYCELKFLDKNSLLQHTLKHHRENTEFPKKDVWDQPEHYFPTYENDQFLINLDKDETEDTPAVSDSNVIPEDLPQRQPYDSTLDLEMSE